MLDFLNFPNAIKQRILLHADTESLLACTATSQELRTQARREFACRRDDLLIPFVADKDALVEAMASCRTFITGQYTIAFFHPEQAPPAHLQTPLTFVVSWLHRRRFIDHLVSKENYHVSNTEDPFALTSEAGFSSKVILRRERNLVMVLESPHECPWYPLPRFHTSSWMNTIGATHFFCAYPRWTLARRAFLNSLHMGREAIPLPDIIKLIALDDALGIDTRTTPLCWTDETHDCPHDEACPLRHRSMVDPFSLVIPLSREESLRRPTTIGRYRTDWKRGGWERLPVDSYYIPFAVNVVWT